MPQSRQAAQAAAADRRTGSQFGLHAASCAVRVREACCWWVCAPELDGTVAGVGHRALAQEALVLGLLPHHAAADVDLLAPHAHLQHGKRRARRAGQGEAAARGGRGRTPAAWGFQPPPFVLREQTMPNCATKGLPLLLPVRLPVTAQHAGRAAGLICRVPPPAGPHPSRHRASTLLRHSPRAGR